MPIVNRDGVELYYERHGDNGEPLVLVHGYTGDITDWRHQVAEFAPTHRVLIMDHRGHGRSSAPDDEAAYTIDAMADDVEAVVAGAGFERYHLVGHSMGGSVSQEIALRSPGRLLSLTLHDTGYNFAIGRNPTVARYFEMRRQVAREQGMAAVANFDLKLPTKPFDSPERKAEEKERMARMSVHGFLGAWAALSSWRGTEDRAKHIAAPTMVIYGDLDRPLDVQAQFLAAAIEGAVLEVVPQAGHSPQWERPDIFNAALRRHLERNAGAGAK